MAKILDIIETERLMLRGIDEADAETIVLLRSAPDVYKFFKSPHQITIEEHLNWYRNRYLLDDNRFDWVCIEKQSGERIGVFGLNRDADIAEINYLLAPDAQHKGYALEAIRRLVDYASKNLGSKQVVAEIHKENKPSIVLIEKLGFILLSKSEPFVIYGIEV